MNVYLFLSSFVLGTVLVSGCEVPAFCLWKNFKQRICLYFMDYTKAFDCVDHSKLWKILQEMGIPDHLICLLRNP